jgi:hypothetical protein
MTLRQQLINDRVENLATSLGIPKDQAFERLVHSIITGKSVHSLDPADWVDGSQDKQIDLISVEEGEQDAELYIISAKFTDSFSSNMVILMGNGLNWIFKQPRQELDLISNEVFRDKIVDVRSTMQSIGWCNVNVRCFFVANALTEKLSPECRHEADRIIAEFDNGSFALFTFEILGADELVGLLNRIERKNRSIDADIPIRYDANSPSLIRYDSHGLKGIVCSATAADIASLVLKDSNGALFDANIRRFLGKGKAVNAEILKTASSSESSYLFWFLNNGITIVCDSCDPISDPDHPAVRVKNLQIVNGCQTATALAHAFKDGSLAPETRVLLKIFQTTDPSLASRIVLTTNNQNRISSRDLKANDPVQQDMQRGFARYKLLYEHKLNQYANTKCSSGERIVSNEDVGQAYLAIALKKPSDGRRRKYKVWEDHYSVIFGGGHVEAYVICLLLFEISSVWARDARRKECVSELRRKLINNGLLHLARIASFLWRGQDSFKQPIPVLQDQISELTSNPRILDPHFNEALDRLESLIKANTAFVNDVDGALKSAFLDSTITKSLHQPDGERVPVQGVLGI